MSTGRLTPLFNSPEGKKMPTLRSVNDCKTNEERLERIIQEIFIKTDRADTIIGEMLLLAGFPEDSVTKDVIFTYDFRNPRDMFNLLKVCSAKCKNDPIIVWKLQHRRAEIQQINIAIYELTKSSLIIGRNVMIERIFTSKKTRVATLLLWIGAYLYISGCKNTDSERTTPTQREVPQITISSGNWEIKTI